MLRFHVVEAARWLRLFRYRVLRYIFYAFGSVDFPKHALVVCIGQHYHGVYFFASGATAVKVIHVVLWFCWFASESVGFNCVKFLFRYYLPSRKAKYHVTSRCSTAPALRACAGQFLSRSFVVLLRKSIPQNRNLKTAA